MTYGDNDPPSDLEDLVMQIEAIIEERDDAAGRIKDLYAAAKDAGFNTGAIKFLIKLRRMDEEARAKMDIRERAIAQYMTVLGVEGTPLWQSAIVREHAANLADMGGISIAGSDGTSVDLTGLRRKKSGKARLRGQRVDLPEEAEG